MIETIIYYVTQALGLGERFAGEVQRAMTVTNATRLGGKAHRMPFARGEAAGRGVSDNFAEEKSMLKTMRSALWLFLFASASAWPQAYPGKVVCADLGGAFSPVCQVKPATTADYKVEVMNQGAAPTRAVILSN